ncbi:uncharacterized protein LOC131161722 isoform X1 [Malania oleifera]|uniref:uncharacterized protein LOC131161722 isoform X1 n=1 Tax=Malania oleifera TaxID=397392 RepID=UPI0025ADFCBC|nr:uncharacterized protein LOC131161722 isoform X1 [Malania oleifera]
MSRCFPYPPPGYVRNGASGQALIESIKRERESAKIEKRKEKKKEKKEKRDKKERREEKSSGSSHGKDKKLTDGNSLKSDKGRVDLDKGHPRKSLEDEAEQLEKSSLTEEHEQPVCLQNICESSDSTQNSYKRKRETSTSTFKDSSDHGECAYKLDNVGVKFCPLPQPVLFSLSCPMFMSASKLAANIIRIRLPLQRHKEADAKLADASLSNERVCSTSGRSMDSLTQPKLETATVTAREGHFSMFTSRDPAAQELVHHRPGKEVLCPTSATTAVVTQDGAPRSKSEKKMQKVESLYKALIENWVPPPQLNEQADFDDQEWLFGTKPRHSDENSKAKKCKANHDALCHGSSSSWPHAHYLPEADIYALPFSVPF